MDIYLCFYVNTARDIVTVLLIFVEYLSLYLHIFTCKYRGTHIQAHVYATRISTQEERGQPGTGAWLEGAEQIKFSTQIFQI